MYWSSVQQLVHHASSGCAMNVGDLLGSGTISRPGEGPARQPAGDQLERHRAGRTARRREAARSWKTAICLSCAAGARATAIASALARSRGRFWRRSSSCHCERSDGMHRSGSARSGLLRRPGMTLDGHRSCGGISRTARNARRHPRGCTSDARACPMAAASVTHTPGRHSVRGPDRPRRKTAAAVRADIVQFVLDAIRAERAFIGADPRFRRVRRQVLVAIFAVRPELQRHGRLVALSAKRIIANRTAKCE